MNATIATQLQDWKAQEFQRTVQRYAAANHDPSAPENRGAPPVYFAEKRPVRTGLIRYPSLSEKEQA